MDLKILKPLPGFLVKRYKGWKATTFQENKSLYKKLAKEGRLDERLLEFDLKKLSEAMSPERDSGFKYLGLQILIDRYFIRCNNKIMETPQSFWMRVAMGLALNEDNKEERAIEFYNLFSNFLYFSLVFACLLSSYFCCKKA